MHLEAPRRFRNLAIVFAGPPLLVFVLLGGAYVFGSREAGVFLSYLPFVVPLVGVVGIFTTQLRGAFKLFLAIIYLPLCAGGVFLFGVLVGCGLFKMHCF